MPFEIVALTFVIVALTAIGARFMARDEFGRVQLPRLIDESIGAYLLRRVTRRSTSTQRHRARRYAQVAPVAPVEPPAPIGPTLIQPTRIVVSSVRRPVTLRPAARMPPRKRPSALVRQRQVAAALAVAVLVLIVAGATLAPRESQGGVLGATGTPAPAERTTTPSNQSPTLPFPTVLPEPPAASGG